MYNRLYMYICTYFRLYTYVLRLVFLSIPLSVYPVARGRSLFGDPTADIQELTQVIKQDISKLNSDIGSLQQQARAQSYGESKHMRTHTSSVVVSLQVSHEAVFCSCCYSSSCTLWHRWKGALFSCVFLSSG